MQDVFFDTVFMRGGAWLVQLRLLMGASTANIKGDMYQRHRTRA